MAALYKQEPDVFALVYETILDSYARNKASLQFPRLALIGGQPGAGKSTVTGVITESLNTTAEPVVINFDDIRNFHPLPKKFSSAIRLKWPFTPMKILGFGRNSF